MMLGVPLDPLDFVIDNEDDFGTADKDEDGDTEETDDNDPQTSVQSVCVGNGPPRKTYPTPCNSATSAAVRFKHFCTITP